MEVLVIACFRHVLVYGKPRRVNAQFSGSGQAQRLWKSQWLDVPRAKVDNSESAAVTTRLSAEYLPDAFIHKATEDVHLVGVHCF